MARLTSFPTSFQAGLTMRLTLSHTSLPASDGGTIAVYVNGPRAIDVADFVVSVSDDDFLVDVSATATEKWKPGVYFYQIVHDDGSAEKDIFASGQVAVVPFVSRTDTYDGRTLAKQTLDEIDQLILGLVKEPMQTQQWGDALFTEKNLDTLRTLKDYYMAIVAGEADDERIANGKNPNNTIRVEFI